MWNHPFIAITPTSTLPRMTTCYRLIYRLNRFEIKLSIILNSLDTLTLKTLILLLGIKCLLVLNDHELYLIACKLLAFDKDT